MSCGHSKVKSDIATQPNEVNMSRLVNMQVGISGMSCTGCENTVAGSVKSMNGIHSVVASYVSGTADIECDTSIATPELITQAIENTGYHVIGINYLNTDSMAREENN